MHSLVLFNSNDISLARKLSLRAYLAWGRFSWGPNGEDRGKKRVFVSIKVLFSLFFNGLVKTLVWQLIENMKARVKNVQKQNYMESGEQIKPFYSVFLLPIPEHHLSHDKIASAWRHRPRTDSFDQNCPSEHSHRQTHVHTHTNLGKGDCFIK